MNSSFLRPFLGFVLVSGVGWLLDFCSFLGMTIVLDIRPSISNFFSSLAGIIYVWFVSLRRVFNNEYCSKSHFLPIYLGYQGISILLYSLAIGVIAASNQILLLEGLIGLTPDVTAKILLTPINLLTNFSFMHMLIRFMPKAE